MASKFVSVTKAAALGAAVGTAVGMVAAPRARQAKKARKTGIVANTSRTLRTVGVAMENIADMIGG